MLRLAPIELGDGSYACVSVDEPHDSLRPPLQHRQHSGVFDDAAVAELVLQRLLPPHALLQDRPNFGGGVEGARDGSSNSGHHTCKRSAGDADHIGQREGHRGRRHAYAVPPRLLFGRGAPEGEGLDESTSNHDVRQVRAEPRRRLVADGVAPLGRPLLLRTRRRGAKGRAREVRRHLQGPSAARGDRVAHGREQRAAHDEHLRPARRGCLEGVADQIGVVLADLEHRVLARCPSSALSALSEI
mmetsp:Transcript_598/g.2519  ORF Transcript_598/g.2519 Transcript_598/m.2519 type:complete len:244 (-) Transcript_598:80-811(-)